MALKSKFVEVQDIGQVEIRELAYKDAEPLFDSDNKNIGKTLIKQSIYINGLKAFDDENLSLADANKLFSLVDEVLEINGMGGAKKTSSR